MPGLDPETWPFTTVVVLFVCCILIIGVAGIRLSFLAARLASLTGLGQALFGGVFLGGVTSLSGSITSITAALGDHPELAVGNAIGGIVAQTAFLGLADIAYRKTNLEHAAASLENLIQGVMLITLLAIPLAMSQLPPWTLWAIHPATLVIPVVYLFGLHLTRQSRKQESWYPSGAAGLSQSKEGSHAQESRPGRKDWALLWGRFTMLALMVGLAGYLLARTAVLIGARTGLSESVMGTLFTSVITSLPELVTTLAAVRQGALVLAVGDIIGGNTFDVLFLAFSDLAYRAGSIYHRITEVQLFVIALAQVMTGLLLLGMLRRKRDAIGNIGFESISVLLLYGAMVALLLMH